ncbi:MAG TPA: hypothetical protein VF595_17530 [Tepidisphaeraceae bacterium]|jgi:hypothetical protein
MRIELTTFTLATLLPTHDNVSIPPALTSPVNPALTISSQQAGHTGPSHQTSGPDALELERLWADLLARVQNDWSAAAQNIRVAADLLQIVVAWPRLCQRQKAAIAAVLSPTK